MAKHLQRHLLPGAVLGAAFPRARGAPKVGQRLQDPRWWCQPCLQRAEPPPPQFCKVFLGYGCPKLASSPLNLIAGCELDFDLLGVFASSIFNWAYHHKSQELFHFLHQAGFPVGHAEDTPAGGVVTRWVRGSCYPVISGDKGSTGIWSRWIPFPRHVARPENPAACLWCVCWFPYLLPASWEHAAGLPASRWEATGLLCHS